MRRISDMNKPSALVVVVLFSFFVLIPRVWADPAGPESDVCGVAQSISQNSFTSGAPYKNPGKGVSTAANAQDPFVQTGSIDEECSSCIMNQFARRIPVADQETCGPDCAHPLCATGVALDGQCS